jgi:hypothetical protein
MQIEQFKKDLDNGVLISKGEWVKLVEAALILKNALGYIHVVSNQSSLEKSRAYKALTAVDKL